MKLLTKSQLLVILGAIFLTVLLLFAPKSNLKKEDGPSAGIKPDSAGHDHTALFVKYEDSLKTVLSSTAIFYWERYQKNLSGNAPAIWADSLSLFWKSLKQPLMAAIYFEKSANYKNTFTAWSEAGRFFQIGFEFGNSEEIRHAAIDKAIFCYTKALTLNPSSAEAKTNLASCYVESGSDPMKGITLLKEVLQKDSNYVEAHFKLGIFSMKSRQFDKAISRFSKVIEINPEYLEAYLYLGEAFANAGDKSNAKITLEKFKKLSKDTIVIAQVNQFIKELESRN